MTNGDGPVDFHVMLARITGDDDESCFEREQVRALAAKSGVWLERNAADAAWIEKLWASDEFWDAHIGYALLLGRTNAQIAEWLRMPEEEVALRAERVRASDEAERRAAR